MTWVRCLIAQRIPVGDHTLVIGRIVAAHLNGAAAPLICLDGRYHELAPVVAS